jgi:Na+:H+ antiporter, NhaA family
MTGTHEQEQSNDILASIVLLCATMFALIIANSGFNDLYHAILDARIGINIGPSFQLMDSTKGWIKNALMAIFFLYVGLEIKAEFTQGALSDRKRATLPFVAAASGMLVPAIIFLICVKFDTKLSAGWAVPSATDIAFAVGVVGLLGRRVPTGLKAFLLAVAVIDDLGAILIIALFYTSELFYAPLAFAGLCLAVLLGLNIIGVAAKWPYLLVGLFLWFFVLRSGINPTLAGVATALFVPLSGKGTYPLHELADWLKEPVIFVIMPIFALANAGVALGGMGLEKLFEPLTLGTSLGLLIGKPIGISLAVWLAVATGLASLPLRATWPQVIGIGFLAGIGFTMSLFIGALAFPGEPLLMDEVRLGVLAGSLSATLIGVAILVGAHSKDARLQAAQ